VLPAPRLARRDLPSGTVTCGSNAYDVSAIENAINGGVQDMQSGDLAGEFYDINIRYYMPDIFSSVSRNL
jgi:hypothetical protein